MMDQASSSLESFYTMTTPQDPTQQLLKLNCLLLPPRVLSYLDYVLHCSGLLL
jgi:hypothetical protein